MTYDCNGNTTSGGTRTIAWDIENCPSSVTSGSTTETCLYDADNERIKLVRAVTNNPTGTTIYLEEVWEETTVNRAKNVYLVLVKANVILTAHGLFDNRSFII